MRPGGLQGLLLTLVIGAALGLGWTGWMGPGGRGADRALAALTADVQPAGARELCALVSGALEHGASPSIPASNWVFRLAHAIGAVPGESQEPSVALEAGRGLCHSAAALAVHVARAKGWRADVIDLGEHVVAEVDSGKGPWVVDADFGVAMSGTIAGLTEDSELRARWLAETSRRGASARAVQAVEAALLGGPHRRLAGTALSPRLLSLERACSFLSRWLPVAVLLFVLAAGLRRRFEQGGAAADSGG